MSDRSLLVAICLLCAWLAPASGSAQDLPLPDQWATHYVWILISNPDYSPASEDEEAALTAAHIQYQLRLQADGRAIAAGGLGQGEPGDLMVGLTILRAESLAEAKAMAAADPAVEAGRLRIRVREWWVPAQRLP